MDGQYQQDNMTTFDEFDQAWSQCDSNNDSSVSLEEVADTLKQLQVGPSTDAELIFGYIDLKNKTELEAIFNVYDNDTDGFITWLEFESGYQHMVDLLDILGGALHSRGDNGSYVTDFHPE